MGPFEIEMQWVNEDGSIAHDRMVSHPDDYARPRARIQHPDTNTWVELNAYMNPDGQVAFEVAVQDMNTGERIPYVTITPRQKTPAVKN